MQHLLVVKTAPKSRSPLARSCAKVCEPIISMSNHTATSEKSPGCSVGDSSTHRIDTVEHCSTQNQVISAHCQCSPRGEMDQRTVLGTVSRKHETRTPFRKDAMWKSLHRRLILNMLQTWAKQPTVPLTWEVLCTKANMIKIDVGNCSRRSL